MKRLLMKGRGTLIVKLVSGNKEVLKLQRPNKQKKMQHFYKVLLGNESFCDILSNNICLGNISRMFLKGGGDSRTE